MPDLTEAIEQAVEDPASHSQDGATITSRSIPDLIAADKYLKSNEAAAQGIKSLVRHQARSPSARGD